MASDSLFLKLVAQESTIRTEYTRNDDARISSIQFPVGWAFFSKQNISVLVKTLSKQVSNIDFSYICPVMQWAYETRGRLLEGNNNVGASVKSLNDLVMKHTITVLQGDQRQQKLSVNYFFGRDMRPYNNALHDPSARIQDKRSISFGQPDPAADPAGMFGEEKFVDN